MIISTKFHNNKTKIVDSLIDVIEDKDSTYSPLALYFLIDNNLIKNFLKEYVDEFTPKGATKPTKLFTELLFDENNSSLCLLKKFVLEMVLVAFFCVFKE